MFALLLSSKTIKSEEYVQIFKEGIKISLPSIIILILAWAIGDVVRLGITLALHSGLDLVVATSAILAGAIYGDHISPISDTTILTSAGTGCSVQSHLITQLPYASISAICAFISFGIISWSNSLLLAYAVGGILLVGIFYYLKIRYELVQNSIH